MSERPTYEELEQRVRELEEAESERNWAEEALRESEKRYRTILGNIAEGYYEVDLAGNLTFLNDSVCELLGYSRDELIGMNNRQYTDERGAAELFRAFNEVYRTGRQTKGFGWEIIRKDGSKRFVEASVTLIKDGEGKPSGFRGIVRDITERKRAEEDLLLQSRLQRLLMGMATTYINVPLDAVDSTIHRSLRDLGCFVGADRAYVFRYDFQGQICTNTHEWCSEGTAPQIDELKAVPLSTIPEWVATHQSGKPMYIPDVHSLPLGSLRDVLEPQGIKSLLAVPMMEREDCFGFVGFDSVRQYHVYTESERNLLTVFAQMLINVGQRKRADERLRESERRMSQIIEFLPDATFVIDIHGKVTAWNKAMESLTGMSASAMLGKSGYLYAVPFYGKPRPVLIDLVIAPDQKVASTYVSFHKGGDRLISETYLDDYMGRGRTWLWNTASPLYNPDGEVVGAIEAIRDISELKRAEEALIESEQQYKSLTERMNDIIWTTDLNMRTTYVSSSVEKVLGFSVEEQMKRPLEEQITPETAQLAAGTLAEELRDDAEKDPERYISLELNYFHRDGSVRCLETSLSFIRDKRGEPAGIQGLSRDITNRKRAEEALQESEERFRHLVEDAPFGISLMRPDRQFEFFNPQFTRITGYTLADLPDKETWFIKAYPDPAYRELVISAWTTDLGKDIKEGEIKPRVFKVRCVDGRDKMVHFRAVSLKDGRQVLTYEDITELKTAEEERGKLQAQLNQAQKMESVGRLAGGVAHDFNNMLQAILGHTELALIQVPSGQALFGELQQIKKAAERSADLVRQLLAFARKQTISPRVLDLNDTVEGMLKMLRRLIGEDIDLVWHPGHGLWNVKVDPGQIDQILANLAVNARDAIVGVGKVTIETGNVTLDEAYCGEHAGFAPGEYVLLAVSDTGVGMTREVLDHLFEPFFTTKEVGKGTGLGLATVYGIVKQNEGFINVYSEPGEGTTVKIYLCPHKAKVERAHREAAGESAARGHETILLVEDEATILDMTRTMLERLGYVVVGARRPGEAIRLAGEHGGEIDLLMTDVVMPEMNGRDLAKNLMRLYPGMKRLFMSGYTANVIAHHGVLDEGVHFIQKPFSMKDLAAKVREALDNE